MSVRAAWAAGAGAAVILLGACTGAGSAGDAGKAGPATPRLAGTLTAWLLETGTPQARAAMDAAVDGFRTEHPDLTVDVAYVPRTEAPARLTAAIAAGEAPDLAETAIEWTAPLAEDGVLAPVAQGDDVHGIGSLVEAGSVAGTAYGYPWHAGTQALIYRTDVLDRAGVDPPTTWDEIFSVGDAISSDVPGIAPIQVAGTDVDLLAPLVWAAGGEIATRTAAGWQAGIDPAAGRAAFTQYEALWKKGWSPREAANWTADDIQAAFAEGKSAMMIGTISDLRSVIAANRQLDGLVATAVLPAGPGGDRDAVAAGSHLVVLENSANPEAARALVGYLTATPQVVAVAEALGDLPGTVEGVEAAVTADERIGAFGEQLVEHSRSYPAASWWQNVVTSTVTTMQRLMAGELTADEAAASVHTAVQSAIG